MHLLYHYNLNLHQALPPPAGVRILASMQRQVTTAPLVFPKLLAIPDATPRIHVMVKRTPYAYAHITVKPTKVDS